MRELSLSAMITMIDASSFIDRLNDRFVGNLVQRQIEAADRLILDK